MRPGRVHAVITNSTYDGLLYNTDFIKKTLDVKSIHFDSHGSLHQLLADL